VLELTLDAVEDVPVFFGPGGHGLFGVLTTPIDRDPGELAAVLVPGGWHGTSADRNRAFVRVARELAADGLPAFRFDFHGVGESLGAIDRFRLDQPFVADLEAALVWLRSAGFRRFILIGLCFGARTALPVAAGLHDVEGLVLISTPVSYGSYGGMRVSGLARRLSLREIVRRGVRLSALRGLTDPRFRRVYAKALRARVLSRQSSSVPFDGGRPLAVDASFREAFRRVRQRGTPVLFIYGQGEDEYEAFQNARGRDDGLLRSLPGEVDVAICSSPVLGFSRLAIQDEVVARLRDWCALRRRDVDGGGK